MGKMQFGLQAFNRRGKSLVAEQPIVGRDRAQALRQGERLAKDKAGVVVYEVEVDEEIGDIQEPVIIARHGELPPAYADIPF